MECICECPCVFVGTCYGDYTVRFLLMCEILSDNALLHDGNALYI